jgi:hypothetical protein
MLRIICLIGIIILVLAGTIYAQAPDPLTDIEVAHVAEIRHVLATYGNDVWPGWGESIPPLLIRKGEVEFLIGHPDPPQDFQVVPDVSIDGEALYWLDGHLTPQPVASVWQVADVWSVAIPVRDEFQGIIDQALGPGVVVLDNATYVQTVVHEMFHAYQFSAGDPNALADAALVSEGEAWIVQQPNLSVLNIAHAREGEALRAALEAETDDIARRLTIDFLQLRQARYAELPPEVAAFERVTEWTEGLARYADVSLMRLTGAAGAEAHEAGLVFEYPPSENVWTDFLAQLADPASVPGSHRDRYYVLGAGQAFLLDRLVPGWYERALADGVLLDDLLQEALTGIP